MSFVFGLCLSVVLLCLTFWACSALVMYALNFIVEANDAIDELMGHKRRWR